MWSQTWPSRAPSSAALLRRGRVGCSFHPELRMVFVLSTRPIGWASWLLWVDGASFCRVDRVWGRGGERRSIFAGLSYQQYGQFGINWSGHTSPGITQRISARPGISRGIFHPVVWGRVDISCRLMGLGPGIRLRRFSPSAGLVGGSALLPIYHL